MDLSVPSVLLDLKIVAAGSTLMIAGCLVLLGGIFETSQDDNASQSRSSTFWAVCSLIAIGIAAAYGFGAPGSDEIQSQRLFRSDIISRSSQFLALLGGAITILLGFHSVPKRFVSEYYGCLLLLLSGMVFVGASNDLAALVLALELVSIPTTVILAMTRADQRGSEATLKYFTLSAFASAIFLLGVSYLYGLAGTTEIPKIIMLLSEQPTILLKLAIGLVLSGMCFRVAAVPFHFYAPDVFEGTSATAASLLSVAPKVAGFLVLARFLSGSLLNAEIVNVIVPVLIGLAVVTMTIGNVLALVQDSVRRMLAYSSVAHSGYLLLALAAIVSNGSSADALFKYLAAYTAMTLGVFAGLAALFDQTKLLKRDDLLGYGYRHPFVAACMLVCFLSLIGIPLTAGFWAKFQVIVTTLESSRPELRWCAIIMGFNSALAAIYYLDTVVKLFVKPTHAVKTAAEPARNPAAAACAICAAVTIVWFLVPSWL
jgi:NADH-quinone oxidoreductase subunit N